MNNYLKNYTNQLLENFKKEQLKFLKKILKKILKFKKKTGPKDNIWGADLAIIQLISKFYKGFRFFWCLVDTFSKYAWIVPFKR